MRLDARGAVVWEDAAAQLMAYADRAAVRAGAGAVQTARGAVREDMSRSARRALLNR